MGIKKGFITLIILFILSIFALHPQTIAAQCRPGTYTCKAFNCYNSATHKYEYDENTCTVTQTGFPLQCQVQQNSSYRTYTSTTQANTNWSNSDARVNCTTPPDCDLGLFGSNIPTCSGGGGGDGEGGSCPAGCNANGDACRARSYQPVGGSCPFQWTGEACNDVPCAYRSRCGCGTCLVGCSESCQTGGCYGGGGGTPTPTPAPSCSLSCPGTAVDNGAGGNAGGGAAGGGTIGGSSDTYYTAAGKAEGDITFAGTNYFNCSTFTDQNGYSGPCPSPTIVSGGGSNVLGAWSKRSENVSENDSMSSVKQALTKLLKHFDIPKSIGSVLGSSTTLAQSNPGGSNNTTWIFPDDFHVLDGNQPKKYVATAIGSGGGLSAGQCSCTIQLTCPETIQDPNDAGSIIEGCDNQCDFQVDPAQEHNNTPSNIFIDIPEGFDHVTLDYDDGSTDTLDNADNDSRFVHTYTNAGVYDVHLTCSTNGQGDGASRSCTRRLTSYCAGTEIGALPTPTPTPTPTPGPWMKAQDSAVHIRSSVTSSVPAGAIAFDATDTASCSASNPNSLACFSSGEAGAVVVESSTADFGTELSKKGWLRKDGSYTINSLMTPSSFIEYVKARKDYKVVTALTVDQLEVNRIHLFNPETTASVSTNTIPDMIPGGSGMVIIVDGDMTIDMTSVANQAFNPSKKAITFVVTGRLQISAATQELNGIFIANEVDYAYDYVGASTVPLKINGNISVMNTPTQLCNEHRARTDSALKPTCLFQFDYPNQFPPIIDLISTRTYDWTELIPASSE